PARRQHWCREQGTCCTPASTRDLPAPVAEPPPAPSPRQITTTLQRTAHRRCWTARPAVPATAVCRFRERLGLLRRGRGVVTAESHQFVVPAGFDDGALFEDEDQVRVTYGTQPVGDDDSGLREVAEVGFDGGLGRGVKVGGRLVQDQYPWLGQ